MAVTLSFPFPFSSRDLEVGMGVASVCTEGYTGEMCDVCTPSHYKDGDECKGQSLRLQ